MRCCHAVPRLSFSLPSTRGKWEVCVRLIVVLLFSPLLISGNQFGRFLCFKNSTAVPPRLFGSRKRRWLCNFVNFRSYAVWDRNYRQTMDSLLNVRRHECGAEKVNIFTPIMAGRTFAFTSNMWIWDGKLGDLFTNIITWGNLLCALTALVWGKLRQ